MKDSLGLSSPRPSSQWKSLLLLFPWGSSQTVTTWKDAGNHIKFGVRTTIYLQCGLKQVTWLFWLLTPFPWLRYHWARSGAPPHPPLLSVVLAFVRLTEICGSLVYLLNPSRVLRALWGQGLVVSMSLCPAQNLARSRGLGFWVDRGKKEGRGGKERERKKK